MHLTATTAICLYLCNLNVVFGILLQAVPPPLPPKFKWLDKRNGISAAPNFVSEEETLHILGLVAQAGNWSASKTGGNAFAGPRDKCARSRCPNPGSPNARLVIAIIIVSALRRRLCLRAAGAGRIYCTVRPVVLGVSVLTNC